MTSEKDFYRAQERLSKWATVINYTFVFFSLLLPWCQNVRCEKAPQTRRFTNAYLLLSISRSPLPQHSDIVRRYSAELRVSIRVSVFNFGHCEQIKVCSACYYAACGMSGLQASPPCVPRPAGVMGCKVDRARSVALEPPPPTPLIFSSLPLWQRAAPTPNDLKKVIHRRAGTSYQSRGLPGVRTASHRGHGCTLLKEMTSSKMHM